MSLSSAATILLVAATAAPPAPVAAGGVECIEAPSSGAGAWGRCLDCFHRHGINLTTGGKWADHNIRTSGAPLDRDVCTLRGERCGLSRLPPQLQHLPCVQHLFLRDNSLEDVGTLDKLPELEVLDLSGNRALGHILAGPNASLLHNAALLSLNLSSCSVQRVAAGAFDGVANLQVLFLRANGLRSLSPEALRPLAQLELLDVSDNPLALLPALPPLEHMRCLLAVRTAAFEGRGGARESLSQLQLRGRATVALSGDAFRHCAEGTRGAQCPVPSDQPAFFRMSLTQWQMLCGTCEPSPAPSLSPYSVPSTTPLPPLLSFASAEASTTSAPLAVPCETAPCEAAVAGANAAVVLLGTVMAALVVAQSFAIVLLLSSRRRHHKGVVRIDTQKATECLENDQYEKLQSSVISDAEQFYSSLNPVYETIAE